LTDKTIAYVGTITDTDRWWEKDTAVTVHGDDAAAHLGSADPTVAAAKEGTVLDLGDQKVKVEKVLPKGLVVTKDASGANVYHEGHDIKKYVSPRGKDSAYGMLVNREMPKWLTGFFAAVIAGAVLSSFNSALNATATLFSLGVYQQMIKRDATPTQVIGSGKWCGLVVALTSMSVAPLLAGQDSIFGCVQKMNGLYFIPIFSVVIVGMLTKHVPAIAAKKALTIGLLAIALGYFVKPFSIWVDAVNGFHFLGIIFAGLIALMLLIGLLKPRTAEAIAAEEAQTATRLEPARWSLALPVGIALTLVVLTAYILLADASAI